MSDDAIPALIRAAGEQTEAAYRAFLHEPSWKPHTRRNYRMCAERFFAWAERRGLTLEAIGSSDIAAYAAEVAAELSPHTANVYVAAIRAAFRHLFAGGRLAANPCEKSMPRSAVRQSDRNESADKEVAASIETRAAGFPLLDLLTFLSYMEEKTLERILGEEAIACALLERVRWPDGRVCAHCGAVFDMEASAEVVCPACAKSYTVITGTMFDGSSVPLRHWLVLTHAMYLAQPGLSDEALQQRVGLDPADILSVCRRIAKAVMQEGLPAGDELNPLLSVRNKELIQDDCRRLMVRLMEMEALRERLVEARDAGTAVDDLPEGMTLDEAIEKIEARIAEDGGVRIWVKDGYLAYAPDEDDSVGSNDDK